MIIAEAGNEFMGQWVYVACALIVAAGAGFGIFFGFRKTKMEIEPQPLETRKVAKRFNHDLAEERHKKITDHLQQHDEQIATLSEQLNRSIQDFERTVGNFEGTLGQVDKTMQMILKKEMES